MSFFDDLLGRTAVASQPTAEKRSLTLSDYTSWLGLSHAGNAANETVSENTALGLTAVYRSVNVIAGTIAGLPLKTYRTQPDDTRVRVASFLDEPAGPDGETPFAFIETLVSHLCLHGNAYGFHRYNGVGAVAAIQLLSPSAVTVELDPSRPGGRKFTVVMGDGTSQEFSEQDITHIKAMSTDGLYGVSPIGACRNAIGSGIAGDKAAGRMFSNGLLLGGVVSVPEDMDEDQAKEIQAGLRNRMSGAHHAGDIAVVNAALDFKPWTMNAQDAQFIESRAFSVEEIARMYGVPKVLLAEDGASTWGSGIAELIRGFQRFTLAAYTSRIEQTLSRLLPNKQFVEFDYAGLLAPSPRESIENMKAEIDAGLMTIDEGRRILNRPPIKGDTTPPNKEGNSND
jgi:HK97 family phage portal protein